MRDEANLIHEGLPIAAAVAQRLARRLGMLPQVDELRSIAWAAVVEAVRTWEAGRSSFQAYAALKARWAIFDEVRRNAQDRAALARLSAVMASEGYGDEFDAELPPHEMPTAEAYQDRLGALLEGHAAALAVGLAASPVDAVLPVDERTPEDDAERAAVSEDLRVAVRGLGDERQRALIERHYFGDEPFDAIAEDLGISKSWASRLHKSAIDELGLALREWR